MGRNGLGRRFPTGAQYAGILNRTPLILIGRMWADFVSWGRQYLLRLAERSGNLRQLINLVLTQGINALVSGDSSAACAFAERAFDLARRDGDPIRIGVTHTLEVMTRQGVSMR